MLAGQHGKESSMDTQDSSISEPLAEVCIDVRSDGMATDKASQDDCKPTSSEDCLRKTNQSKTKKVHVGASSKDTPTNKASPDGCRPPEVKIKVEVHGNYRPLFEAAVKGNWKAAEKILNDDGEAMAAKVMTVQKQILNDDREAMAMTGEEKSKTVLEVAVMAAQDQFVENLVKRWPSGFSDDIFKSALKHAASRGRIRMVKALVHKVDVDAESILRALNKAIAYAPMQKEVIWYLARRLSVPTYTTMSKLILAGHLDIVLHLAPRYYGSTTSKNNDKIKLLKDLAKMESCFRSRARLNFLEKCIYKCIPLCLVYTSLDNSKDTKMGLAPFIKRIGESKLRHKCSLEFANLALPKKETCMITPEILKLTSETVIEAASHGISEIVKLCVNHFPELMWDKDFATKLIREVINGRQVELFRLANAHLSDGGLMKKGLLKVLIKRTPRCVSPDVSGAAFLMQRELQWYKVIEDRTEVSMKSQKFRSTKSSEEETYWESFVEQRQDLLKEAGQWMKDTSSSCSLVATLIITVAFAAAFAVPGGNDSNTGIPIFLKNGPFMVFAIADALALFSSVTATLMFLAILTSRYEIKDFLHSLPRKMIMGLTFLLLSLGFMLVAFGSAITMVVNERLKWIGVPIYLLVALPIVLFTMLQFPLYFEMVISTFRPRLYRPEKLWK